MAARPYREQLAEAMQAHEPALMARLARAYPDESAEQRAVRARDLVNADVRIVRSFGGTVAYENRDAVREHAPALLDRRLYEQDRAAGLESLVAKWDREVWEL